MTGAGNDFIVIDDRVNVIGNDARELAKQLCRRRLSVGADGLMLIVPSTRADFRMRYFNADGSEADMCGNGGRCVAKFAHEKGIAGPAMTFESRSGLHDARILRSGDVLLNMADPRAILLDNQVQFGGEMRTLHRINTGVPHAVCEVEQLNDFPVVEVGRLIRYYTGYVPEGTNADFMEVLDEHTVALRTYERGVENETLACGTGAVAAALISAVLGKTRPPIEVHTRGGDTLTVDFYMSDVGFSGVTLTGNADIIYEGALEQSED
ncbi:MAG: diaminopimelate epimerase [Candidatus Eisenbacteria bacterium]|nr:diaminopimelate epimerase [Candidatus Eisenbacteria bacterium]